MWHCLNRICATGALVGMLMASSVPAQVPEAPSELTVQASRPGDPAISLFWLDNSSNETGFEIQRSVGDGSGPFETVSIGTLNNVGSYNDVALTENTSYTYRVRAYNAEGSSAFSNLASAKTSYLMPNQVANLVGTVIGGDVHLSWTDMADNETLFAVERAELGVSVAYETIASLPPDSNAYVDTTALDGITYSYRITPWRFDIAGGAPLTVELQTGPALASLRSVSARARSRSAIDISWRGDFNRNTRVMVQRFDVNSGFWTTIGQVSASDKQYTDSRLQPRTAYSYRLRIVTRTAVSGWSETSATTR